MLESTKRRLPANCGCGIEPLSGPGMSRRQLLAGSAAAVAVGTATGFVPKVFAQAAPHRIDVHHHVSPPTWLDAVKSIKRDTPPMANWSVQKSLEDMDKGGVATAITSPTTPQVIGLDKATAARVARESNEYCKKLEGDHKGRFGTFAMLPFPHVDECLKEIAYAFDTLKVDGVNIALIPNTTTPVQINTVNGGNPFGTGASNPQYFVNNDPSDGGPFYNIQYDGFTKVFTATTTVGAGTHHMEFFITDLGDSSLDSAVFVQAGSFSENETPVPLPATLLLMGAGLVAMGGYARTARRASK